MITIPDSVTTFLDKFTIGWVVRKLAIAVPIALALWAGVGSYVIAIADEAVVNVMKKHGIDPETFKDMQKAVAEANQTTGQLKTNDLRIESDLATLKAQNKQIIDILTKDQR